jgi:hypothetical protein
MNELIEYGWIKRDLSDKKHKNKFQRISILMNAYKAQDIENFEYVLIDKYFIDKNNLYFIGNGEIYCIDLNDDFNIDIYKDPEGDYNKIKFICKYSIENIIKFELISNKYKRDKRIDEIIK